MRCPLTYKALDYAYSDLIPRGRYPLAALKLTVDPATIDINIHPTKKEIKYSNGNEVYLLIQRALLNSLRDVRQSSWDGAQNRHAANLIEKEAMTAAGNTMQFSPQSAYQDSLETHYVNALSTGAESASDQRLDRISVSVVAEASGPSDDTGFSQCVVEPEQPHAFDTHNHQYEHHYEHKYDHQPGTSEIARFAEKTSGSANQLGFHERLAYRPYAGESQASAPASATDSAPSAYKLPAGWRIAGYLHNTYIVVETSEGMEIIEQHIAHERTLYERLLAQQSTAGRVSDYSQQLLVSQPLDLTSEQKSVLAANLDILKKLGFDFETDDDSVVCNQVPVELAHKDYAAAIHDLIEQIATADSANLELEATKSIACQSAIKNGMPLGHNDLIKLISEWYETPRNDTCPHGRPVKLSFSTTKLFQLFHPA